MEKIKREYWFEEFGYFTPDECEAVRERMSGSSYMNFNIRYSNICGNCILCVETDYDAPEKEIKNFFINCVIAEILKLCQKNEALRWKLEESGKRGTET